MQYHKFIKIMLFNNKIKAKLLNCLVKDYTFAYKFRSITDFHITTYSIALNIYYTQPAIQSRVFLIFFLNTSYLCNII